MDSRDNSFQPLVFGYYRLIHSGDVKIYENLDVLPRAFQVPEWAVADDAAAALTLMHDPSFNPARQAVVTSLQSPVSSLSVSQTLSLPVSITTYQPEHIEMTVAAAAPALLILTDSYYPGWQATDGKTSDPPPGGCLFRGVFVPAGEHQVVMTFCTKELGTAA
ncbi:MAG: hypothetical protein IPL78_14015 [Chloroflexi bacterium]|nr:hypothetical protein [Chloroflexota bacterium]